LDPHETFAISKFRVLITLGLYQFLMFVMGFTLFFIMDDETFNYVGDIITKGYPDMIMLMKVFQWILLVHASLFSLYFFLYMIFVLIVLYFFRKMDGFSQYMHDLNEFEEDTDDEMADTLKTSKKQAEGIIRSDRAISKIGVQKVIHNFMQESKPFIIKLRSKINKYEGLITFK